MYVSSHNLPRLCFKGLTNLAFVHPWRTISCCSSTAHIQGCSSEKRMGYCFLFSRVWKLLVTWCRHCESVPYAGLVCRSKVGTQYPNQLSRNVGASMSQPNGSPRHVTRIALSLLAPFLVSSRRSYNGFPIRIWWRVQIMTPFIMLLSPSLWFSFYLWLYGRFSLSLGLP
jgi:hypothetical protein